MEDIETESGVAEFARVTLGIEADLKQREVLDSKAKRGILNCTRQWGKSTVAAIKAVHRAVTEPGSLALVASPTERQSAEFLNKVEEFVRKLGGRVRGDGNNRLSVLLPKIRAPSLPSPAAPRSCCRSAAAPTGDYSRRPAPARPACVRIPRLCSETPRSAAPLATPPAPGSPLP